MRCRSHGLCVGPYAECSVEEPIANSSMLVLPRIGIPAALILVTIVASYGGIQPCRILDPAVVGMPLVVAMSFTAIGTPARMCSSSPALRRWSMLRAVAMAPSASMCRKALTAPSTASIRSRCAWVASTALISLRDRRSASLAALARVISEVTAEPLFGGTGGATRWTGRTAAGDGAQSSSRIRGTEKRCCSEAGAPASASCAVRLGRTTSGRVTLLIGIGWDVAGTSSVATSFTRATDSRMMASSPDILSSSASLRSMRASMARWATSSREIADMPSSLVGRPESYAACSARCSACWLGDENAAASQPAGIQVVHGVVHRLQRVGLGEHGDPAGGVQGHQLNEVVVAADQVPDDVALGRDHVDGRDVDRPAIPDDEVAACPSGHCPAVALRALLPHEVQDHLGAHSVRHLEDLVYVPAIHDDGLVRPPADSQGQSLLVGVEHDDAGGAHRAKALDAEVAKASRPHHDAGAARVQQGDGLLHRVVSRETGVRQRGHGCGLNPGGELDHGEIGR